MSVLIRQDKQAPWVWLVYKDTISEQTRFGHISLEQLQSGDRYRIALKDDTTAHPRNFKPTLQCAKREITRRLVEQALTK